MKKQAKIEVKPEVKSEPDMIVQNCNFHATTHIDKAIEALAAAAKANAEAIQAIAENMSKANTTGAVFNMAKPHD